MSKLLEKVLFVAAVFMAAPVIAPTSARADGCYQCGDKSTDACKSFCRFTGEDTFAARKDCEKRGCKVGSSRPVACPAEPSKICIAPTTSTGTTVASIPWCSSTPAPSRS